MMEAMAHLAARGHRRVGLVETTYKAAFDPKKVAFVAACDRHGVEPAYFAGRSDIDDARRLGRDLAGDTRGITALIVYSDHMATGVIRGLADEGATAPDDLAVMGTDGTMMGNYFVPALTSIAQDRAALVAASMDLVLERIENADAPVRTMRLPTKLIVRESA